MLILFPVGDIKGVEISAPEFGGEPYGIALRVIFNQSIWQWAYCEVMI